MKKGFDIVSIIFWIVIIFYLDPGGFQSSGVEKEIDSTKKVIYLVGFISVIWMSYILKYQRNENKLLQDKFLQSYIYIMVIWSLYYFLWFYGLNNPTYAGPYKMITQNGRMIGQIIIVVPIAYFASVRLDQFVKILSWSTIIIMIMFLISVFLKIELIEIIDMERGMGLSVKRYFMRGYGIMSFTIPLALSLLMMKYKTHKIIVIAALLVAAQLFLSILRRDIIGIIEYSIIISIIVNYVNRSTTFNFLWRFINLKSISFVVLIIVIIITFSPGIIETAQILVEKTYRNAILGDVGRGEAEDVRMSLTAQYGIVKAIEENLFFGTGFDPAWNTGNGGVKGFEGSDYIFLATFGMYGLVGLLIFLPFYIIVIKVVIRFLKLLRSNLEIIKENKSTMIFPVIVGLAACSEFIKNIIEYPNWFYPIGALYPSPIYFIYFGLLVGSYYQIVKRINSYKLKQFNE